MIKQSFLRNYNIGKIYQEAEAQKKKVQVFYIRQVSKLLKERYHENKKIQLQKVEESHRQEKKELHRKIVELEEQGRQRHVRIVRKVKTSKRKRTEEEEQVRERPKVELNVTLLNIKEQNQKENRGWGRFNRKKIENYKTFYQKLTNTITTPTKTAQNFLTQEEENSVKATPLSNQKFMTSPSFYEHLQNRKNIDFPKKKATMLDAVRKRLKKDNRVPKRRLMTQENEREHCIFNNSSLIQNSQIGELTPRNLHEKYPRYEPMMYY